MVYVPASSEYRLGPSNASEERKSRPALTTPRGPVIDHAKLLLVMPSNATRRSEGTVNV